MILYRTKLRSFTFSLMASDSSFACCTQAWAKGAGRRVVRSCAVAVDAELSPSRGFASH